MLASSSCTHRETRPPGPVIPHGVVGAAVPSHRRTGRGPTAAAVTWPRVRRLGLGRFTVAVRRELARWDATRPCLRIVRAVYAAAADPSGVIAHRPGALERASLAVADWHDTLERLAAVEVRMIAVLD